MAGGSLRGCGTPVLSYGVWLLRGVDSAGSRPRITATLLDTFLARLLLRIRYRSRSLATNAKQFNAAVAAIEAVVAATPEPVLRGRHPVPALPGVTPIMRGWSAFMTIEHCNGVHEALLGLIAELEAGSEIDIGDIGRFDHPAECGPEVMPRFRDLAARIATLPQMVPFTGRATFVHPILGRLDSSGAVVITRVGEEPCPQLIHATPQGANLRRAALRHGGGRVVRAELDFRRRVVAADKAIQAEGLSFPADRAAVMRLLAPRFTKNEMRRVHAALVAATA